MNKFLLFSLIAVFLFACQADEDDAPFVTDIVISPAVPVAPGDEVVIMAQGFETDDQIMFRITWPRFGEAIPEGYADGVWGVVTARTQRSITFLAPGGYPASKVEIKLFRQGHAMSLGGISVSNGLPPKEFSLYGIIEYLTEETGIGLIDRATGHTMQVQTFGSGQHLACAVNVPGTNIIYGVSPLGGNGAMVSYDLTMRYFRDSGGSGAVGIGVVGASPAFLHSDGELLRLGVLSTRMLAPNPVSWVLPEGVVAAMLSQYPFVQTGQYIQLSAQTTTGTFKPLVLVLKNGDSRAYAGDPIEADAMIPFRMPVRSDKPEVGVTWVGGYAVAKDGVTRLGLFDLTTMSILEQIAEVPGTALSIAVLPGEGDAAKIYVLCDDGDAGRYIRVYDTTTKQLTTLPEAVSCSQIVLVR